MYKLWPSPLLFAAAIFLVVKGCGTEETGRRQLAENPGLHFLERDRARRDVDTGNAMQIGGGVLAVVGAVLYGLGLLHRRVQSHALSHRLAVTYEFVSAIPAEGATLGPALFTEDQAVDQLTARYPTLAATAGEKLRKEFAEKRRQEPTKLWYVKDFQVREAPPSSP